jgi:hypothetical protein
VSGSSTIWRENLVRLLPIPNGSVTTDSKYWLGYYRFQMARLLPIPNGSVTTDSKYEFERAEGKRPADDITDSKKQVPTRYSGWRTASIHAAPGCLAPAEVVSALIQLEKRMLPRRNHGIRTPMMQEGGEEDSGGSCAASSDSTQQAFLYDVFISHAWDKDDEGRDNNERAKRLNAGLQQFGVKTWFDEEQMQGDVMDRWIKESDSQLFF